MTLVLALAAGCRDIVTPEGAVNRGYPDTQIQVFGLGSDRVLVDARVRIDNSAYVPAASVVVAETTTAHQGIAVFEEIPPGLYDIDVKPISWRHSTPPWSVEEVPLGDWPTIVEYEGIPCTFSVDWPLLDEVSPADADRHVSVSYESHPDELIFFRGTQIFSPDQDGLFRGVLPWEGNFRVAVESGGTSFALGYAFPDSFSLGDGDHVDLPSPLLVRAIELRVGDEPFTTGRVKVEHRSSSSSISPSSTLRYVLDRTARPDSLVLIGTGISRLTVEWIEGPSFLERTRYLDPGPVSPGTIDLGEHRLTFRVTDEESTPVAASIMAWADRRSESWSTDESGFLELHAGSEPIGIEISAAGFENWIEVIDVRGDEDLEITLIREAP